MAFPRTAGSCLALVLVASALAAEPKPYRYPSIDEKGSVPEGARVTLAVDQPTFLLGENVLIHWTLENTGAEPFEFGMGGDYRGSTRALRFTVTATDAAGKVAEDPDKEHQNFGGLVGPNKLAPGGKKTESLALTRYCQIDAPGTYTIRVEHDLGWSETAQRKRPVGEIKVTFRMPDEGEAEAVVAAMEKMKDGVRGADGKSTQYADFTCLRYEVYLPALTRRARAGNEEALAGVASIPTLTATKALLEMASNPEEKLSLRAARTLNSRLPDPEFSGALPGRGPFRFDRLEERRAMAAKTWDAKLAPAVRALAVRLLGRDETEPIGTGAFMVQAVGTVAEAPAVTAAVDRVIDKLYEPRRKPDDNILNLPEPLPELARAVLALGQRGYKLDGALSGSGQIFAHFTLLQDDKAPRSEQWLQSVSVWAVNSRYPVREAALRSIPDPMPKECVPVVLECLTAPDLGVVRVACEVAQKTKLPIFAKPGLLIIATEDHEWLLRAASNMAYQCGARFELYEAWADRLSSPKLFSLALDSLAVTLKLNSHGSSGRTDLTRSELVTLKQAWKEFLTQHAAALKAGQQFALDDPAVTPSLFGRARTYHLENGKEWPPGELARQLPPKE
jgi:hypothetical protein